MGKCCGNKKNNKAVELSDPCNPPQPQNKSIALGFFVIYVSAHVYIHNIPYFSLSYTALKMANNLSSYIS